MGAGFVIMLGGAFEWCVFGPKPKNVLPCWRHLVVASRFLTLSTLNLMGSWIKNCSPPIGRTLGFLAQLYVGLPSKVARNSTRVKFMTLYHIEWSPGPQIMEAQCIMLGRSS